MTGTPRPMLPGQAPTGASSDASYAGGPATTTADARPAGPFATGTSRPWLVVYDGLCGFCERSARVLARWDARSQQLAILPHTDPRVAQLAPQIAPEAFTRALQIVRLTDGTVYEGADGIGAILRHALPFGRVFALWWALPGGAAIARAVYRVIARNRKRLGCDGACAIV